MSRRDGAHNRKTGDRYPCGRLRPGEADIAERREEKRRVKQILAQPHRRGERSQLAESAIGRFILRHWTDEAMRQQLYDAALRYAATNRKWASAWGAPMADLLGGNGGDVPIEVINEWSRNVRGWEREMCDAGLQAGKIAVYLMAVHNQDLSPHANPTLAIRALAALSATMLTDRKSRCNYSN